MRPDRIEDDLTGEDSFLDVVANIVGVLIILVMMVGAQASHTAMVSEADPPSGPPGDASLRLTNLETPATTHNLSKLRAELDQAKHQAMASQGTIQEMAERIVNLHREAELQDQQRIKLSMHQALIEEDLQRRRDQLDAKKQQEYDVQRKIMESKLELEELTQQQLAQLSAAPEVETVESVPTPLAKTVDGPAIHLRLRKGLVSIVPLEELMAELQYHVEQIRQRLQNRETLVETFGPINGYRMRLTISRQAGPESVGGPRAGQLQRTVYEQYAEFLPNSEDLGQNVEQALMPGATLYKYLQAHRRQDPPVVVWLYTDSFDEFRILKRALWEMGFSLATRPLPPGVSIAASSHGTKSAAQ